MRTMIVAWTVALVASCGGGDDGRTKALEAKVAALEAHQSPGAFWYCVAFPEVAAYDAETSGTNWRLATTCFRDRKQCESFVRATGTCIVTTTAWCTRLAQDLCVADKHFCDSVASQNHGEACKQTAP